MLHLKLARLVAALLGLSLLASSRQDPPPTPFSQADLERLVAELSAVAPPNPNYAYPIEVRLVEEDTINAGTFPLPRDGVLVPQLVMMTGLVRAAKGDARLLRAVLAHEVAHLSIGHSLEPVEHQDLLVWHTRQQEFEADRVGAQYLVALGHPATDMIDMLALLDRTVHERGTPWLQTVTGDHASPITRASRLAGGDDLLAAVSLFEIGLACMECRRYPQALAWFDAARARGKGWDLHEADLNSASAALQEYYDRLPAAVQEEWLRPEFGPHLTDVLQLRGRAIEIGAEDLARYDEALRRIAQAPSWFSVPMQPFLIGTAHVLHPRGDPAVLRQGVAELQAILDGPVLGFWDLKALRMHVANNLALGLHRLGERERAAAVLIDAQQRHSTLFVPGVAENFARLPLDKLSKEQALLAANVLFHFLTWTPTDAPGGREAERALDGLKRTRALELKAELKRAPVALCGVASMIVDGREVGLFEPFFKVSEALGTNPTSGFPNPRLPELRFLIWGDSELIALSEGEQLVKLTSYRPGSALELRPVRESGLRTVYRVRVGMTVAELDELLSPANGTPALEPAPVLLLNRRSFERVEAAPPADAATDPAALPEELWIYFPQLNFGVLIEGEVVAGISVTPVK